MMRIREAASVSGVFAVVLLFITQLQSSWVTFGWGNPSDESWLIALKRIYLLLPILAAIFGIWTSLACIFTVILREKRKEYLISVFVTWWDLFKAVAFFWGGSFQFIFYVIASVFGFLKGLVIGVLFVIQDIVLVPFRIIRNVAENVLSPGIPWIAVILTMIWCLIEAGLFTYVTTPLVGDVMSNLTGTTLPENFLQACLFVFMLFLVVGSYAVLTAWTQALATKNAALFLKISVVEFFVMVLEVLFLYREFVDALVPWFAQHSSGNFELGIVGTLLISTMVWLGIRSISWFLFASHGIPTITALIKRTGLASPGSKPATRATSTEPFAFTLSFMASIKKEMDWIKKAGDDVIGSFALPPLQIVAAAVNFASLLIAGEHLFSLPLTSFRDVLENKVLLRPITVKDSKRKSDD